jgi:hypothetical protein
MDEITTKEKEKKNCERLFTMRRWVVIWLLMVSCIRDASVNSSVTKEKLCKTEGWVGNGLAYADSGFHVQRRAW